MQISEFRDLLANDGFAATFQTMGQYRTELLRALDGLRAQADARQVFYVADDLTPEMVGKGCLVFMSTESFTGCTQALYTHSEASAPGLSDEQILQIADECGPGGKENRYSDPWQSEHYIAFARALTRASAATVALHADGKHFVYGSPEATALAQAKFYKADGATVADPSDRRRMFEVAEVSRGNDVTRDDDGHYVNQFVQERWEDFSQQQAEPSKEEPVVVRLLRHELGVALKCLSEAEAEKVTLQVQLEAAQQQAEPGADEIHAAWIAAGQPHSIVAFQKGYQSARAAQSGQRAGVADTAAAHDVLAERIRHLTHEGWTPAHDDEHANGDIGEAAICYIQGKTEWGYGNPHQRWPWALCWWKPTDRRRNLVKAGALILAEIERLDRAAVPTQQQEGGV